jgi:hypothetical protein
MGERRLGGVASGLLLLRDDAMAVLQSHNV